MGFYDYYDVAVVGAGHAGIEAALASARMGLKTVLITQSPDAIGRMSCNPSIGGIAKGNIVREIDALGGEMAKIIDKSMIQFILTAFFNSSLFKYCFRENFPELQGGTRELSKIFFDKIPVKQIDSQMNQKFEEKILRIQDNIAQGRDTRELEIELDKEIFNLYGLNEDEVKEIGFIEIK